MHRSMNSYGDLSDMALKNVLALADGEDPEDPDPGEDGGELPPVTVTCSSSCTSEGTCYKSEFFPDLGRSYCVFSGDPAHSCSC